MRLYRYIMSVLVVLLLSAATTYAIMPPQVYAERSEASKIKAIATIVSVESDDTGFNKVTFALEYGLTKDTPKTFVGTCMSVVTEKQKNMVGGTIYYYPNKGERVFVTIADDGGQITSMTDMTDALEAAIKKTPEKLRYGIRSVRVDK